MDGLLGFDPEQLKALMSQFGASEQDRADIEKQKRFAFGFGMLANAQKGQTVQAIGRSGLGAMAYGQKATQDLLQNKQQELQNQLMMAKFQQAAQGQQAAQQYQQEMGGAFSNAPNLANMGPGGPTPANAQATAPNAIQQYRQAAMIAAKNGKTEDAKRYSDIANSMEEEFSTNPNNVLVNGQVRQQLISKRGTTKQLDSAPAVPLHFGANGASANIGYNPFTGAQQSSGSPMEMSFADKNAAAHLQLARNADKRAADAAGTGGKPQWDSLSGQFVFPPSEKSPAGMAVSPAGFNKPDKPLTESQAKATAYVSLMDNANRELANLEKANFTGKGNVQQMDIANAGSDVPIAGAVQRYFSSDNAQKYRNAELQWTEPQLRFMTGANAPKEEVVRAAATFFPRPGDSDAVIEQKAQARANAEQAMRLAAGAGSAKVPEAKTAVASQSDYDKLPKGAIYTAPDGSKRRKQ